MHAYMATCYVPVSTMWCVGGAHVADVRGVLLVLSILNGPINVNAHYLIYTP